MSSRPLASLSLDLDNLWSYMKTHNDPGWEAFPTYLDLVVPRFLDLLSRRDLQITVFVVGQDAALACNHEALRSIAVAGHEIANHSFKHEPWLHRYSPAELVQDIEMAEQAIEAATGERVRGFRGPGYSLSAKVLDVLAARGYDYDCSTFPTFIGPLARAYYFFNARLGAKERDERKVLFGSVRDGLRPLKPYVWETGGQRLLEIPVTTMPVLRAPFHFSYLHWLAGFSEKLSDAYFAAALAACKARRIEPSLLLHPLDFLGKDDLSELAFFPGMKDARQVKLKRMDRWLDRLATDFEVVPMGVYAAAIRERGLSVRAPDLQKLPTPVKQASSFDAAQDG